MPSVVSDALSPLFTPHSPNVFELNKIMKPPSPGDSDSRVVTNAPDLISNAGGVLANFCQCSDLSSQGVQNADGKECNLAM